MKIFNLNKKNKGFSLLELLIVTVLMALVARFAIPTTIRFYDSQITKSTADDIYSSMKKAQVYAQTSRGDSNYGIKFNPDNDGETFVIFKGSSYNPSDENNQIFSLYDINVNFNPPNEGGVIYFFKNTGKPSWEGVITLSKRNTSVIISTCDNSKVIEYGSNCAQDIILETGNQ